MWSDLAVLNYQGNIFDSIVVMDPVEFKDVMYYYVAFQVTS